jgi:hypothetical protein
MAGIEFPDPVRGKIAIEHLARSELERGGAIDDGAREARDSLGIGQQERLVESAPRMRTQPAVHPVPVRLVADTINCPSDRLIWPEHQLDAVDSSRFIANRPDCRRGPRQGFAVVEDCSIEEHELFDPPGRAVSRPGDDNAAVAVTNQDHVVQVFTEQHGGDIGDMGIEACIGRQQMRPVA